MRGEPSLNATDTKEFALPRMPATFTQRSWWGQVSDVAYWQAIFKLYEDDKVQGAHQMAIDIGEGIRDVNGFRYLEAEYETREAAQIVDLTDWLSIEFVPGELPASIEAVFEVVRHEVESTAARFGWKPAPRVRVTLLSQAFEARWGEQGYGYCAQKTPYYKLCLPHSTTLNPSHFVKVLTHEFAHVISLELSHGRIPKWFGEGFSVYVSNDHAPYALAEFVRDRNLWVAAEELEIAIGSVQGQNRPNDRWMAYQQAGWIVRFLASNGGDDKLLSLLSQVGDESVWRNIKVAVLGRSPLVDPLESLYGTNLSQLFADTYEAVATLRG